MVPILGGKTRIQPEQADPVPSAKKAADFRGLNDRRQFADRPRAPDRNTRACSNAKL